MANVIEVTEASFEESVLKATGTVLVDFWAPWCGPCRTMRPVLDELAEDYGDSVQVAKVNVDDNQQVAARYEILSIPTLLVFRGGEVQKRLIGALPKKRLLEELSTWLEA